MTSEWKWFYDTAIDIVINNEGVGVPRELIKGEVLTESGGPTWTITPHGFARDYVTAADRLADSTARRLRLETTVFQGVFSRSSQADSVTRSTIAKRDGAANPTNFATQFTNSTPIFSFYWHETTFQLTSTAATFPTEKFVNLALVRDVTGTIGRIYYDGKLQKEQTGLTAVATDSTNLVSIGGRTDPAEEFDGYISYTYILRHEATPFQIEQISRDPFGPFRVPPFDAALIPVPSLPIFVQSIIFA